MELLQQRRGWIINLDRTDATVEVLSAQKPVFIMNDGTPCFEVWKWHSTLQQWFAMSYLASPAMVEKGVIYYTPEDVPHKLRAIMQRLERDRHAAIVRAR